MKRIVIWALIALAALAAFSLSPVGNRSANAASGCLGENGLERIHLAGSASSTTTHQFNYCSDETLDLTVFLAWDSGTKNLALRVIEPDGTAHLVDSARTTTELYFQAAPLPEGTWTVQVVNMGKGKVNYRLTVVVG